MTHVIFAALYIFVAGAFFGGNLALAYDFQSSKEGWVRLGLVPLFWPIYVLLALIAFGGQWLFHKWWYQGPKS